MSVFERLYDSFFRPTPEREDWGKGQYKENEAPGYAVERRTGDVEIRRYEPTIRAEVTTSGEREKALQAGFRTLAGYIFGGNSEERKVAMTVPVQQEAVRGGRLGIAEGDGGWTISFMMPAAFSRESLPEPVDPSISFVEYPADREAVLLLEDRATDDALEDAAATLLAAVRAEGLVADGPVKFWFYDDPMTPFWKRRNEVSVRLAG